MDWNVRVFLDENTFNETPFATREEAYDYGWSIQDTLEGKIWAIYNSEDKCIHSSDIKLVHPDFNKVSE